MTPVTDDTEHIPIPVPILKALDQAIQVAETPPEPGEARYEISDVYYRALRNLYDVVYEMAERLKDQQ